MTTDITETIIGQFIRLIALCEDRGIDIDLLFAEARHRHSGEPDVQEGD
jgi:hypothetical protein